jgi:hypothetical protein
LVIYSITHKIAILLELTSPIEENMEKRHQEKIDKYSQIQPNEGWSIHVFAVEVGAKGWILRKYFNSTFKQIGISKRNKIISECSKMARRCSYAIWVNRFNKDFRTFRYKSLDIPPELIFHKLTTITPMLPSTPTTRITDISISDIDLDELDDIINTVTTSSTHTASTTTTTSTTSYKMVPPPATYNTIIRPITCPPSPQTFLRLHSPPSKQATTTTTTSTTTITTTTTQTQTTFTFIPTVPSMSYCIENDEEEDMANEMGLWDDM